MNKRYLCIHGHFYQPPRENPWLESIEEQTSAHPYHDWNARVTAECYRPMMRARILDEHKWISTLMNNYSHISFNFGPTLLSWLESEAPDVYRAILRADRRSADRFGVGSALAQAHGHIILPLANDRDRKTQIAWGVRDFQQRFDRSPDGMWLPETAVDTATLEALADAGIRYTILAPHQAAAFRRIGEHEWTEKAIDPSRPYRAVLPSGRELALFFYDGPVSQAVAFERLLDDAGRFEARIMEGFDRRRDWPQLMHIATDGESYGHHHRHGEMALAAVLQRLDQREDVELTNYAAYLAAHPPEYEARIAEPSSWSCAHGVERWRSDCGCHTGGDERWHQRWRQPLREALDWLRDEIAPEFERAAGEIFDDPWAARDDYIEVLLDRSEGRIRSFFNRNGHDGHDQRQMVRGLQLMEMQRHAMMMYTSCGWFFNELSGIETVQVLQYAGRTVQLAEKLFGRPIESGFLERLERAQSNLPEHGNGRQIYDRWVTTMALDLQKVAAHYAMSSLFEDYEDRTGIFCYDVERLEHERRTAGSSKLEVGRARLRSRVTWAEDELEYAAVHLGEHVMTVGVRPPRGTAELYAELLPHFECAHVVELVRAIDRGFDRTYALGALFRDEQRKVVGQILDESLREVNATYARIHRQHAPLLRFLRHMELPIPAALSVPSDLAVNNALKAALTDDPPRLAEVRELLDEAREQGVRLDEAYLGYAGARAGDQLARRLAEGDIDDDLLETIEQLVTLPLALDHFALQSALIRLDPERIDAATRQRLGDLLKVRLS